MCNGTPSPPPPSPPPFKKKKFFEGFKSRDIYFAGISPHPSQVAFSGSDAPACHVTATVLNGSENTQQRDVLSESILDQQQQQPTLWHDALFRHQRTTAGSKELGGAEDSVDKTVTGDPNPHCDPLP